MNHDRHAQPPWRTPRRTTARSSSRKLPTKFFPLWLGLVVGLLTFCSFPVCRLQSFLRISIRSTEDWRLWHKISQRWGEPQCWLGVSIERESCSIPKRRHWVWRNWRWMPIQGSQWLGRFKRHVKLSSIVEIGIIIIYDVDSWLMIDFNLIWSSDLPDLFEPVHLFNLFNVQCPLWLWPYRICLWHPKDQGRARVAVARAPVLLENWLMLWHSGQNIASS